MSNTFVGTPPTSGHVAPDELVMYGGTDNEVWGNTFLDPPGVTHSYSGSYAGIAMAESGDLIYNNNFEVDNPVVLLPFNYANVADCLPQSLGGCSHNQPGNAWYYNVLANVIGNSWNITPQPASNVHTFNGYSLSGNVMGAGFTVVGATSAGQGGNFWWNYGHTGAGSVNNASTLPYVSRFAYTDWSNIFPLGCGTIEPPNGPCIVAPPVVGSYENGIEVGGDYAPIIPTVTVTFTESGLPAGTGWSVTVGSTTHSSTNTTILFQEGNGSYSYTATVTGGIGGNSVPFTVSGPTSVHVQFYKATFTESKLPTGTSWQVTANGMTLSASAPTSIVFYVTNGTYPYSIGPISGYHTVDHGTFVITGTSLTVHSTFAPTTYTVKFTETGLTSAWHTTWCVTYNSTTTCTTGSSIAFTGIRNGSSYTYSIGHVANYSLDGSYTGSGSISGGGGQGQIVLTVPAHFVLVKYTVTFTESGLPSHGSWQVTMNGKTTVSTGNKITFSESNGTYAFTIVAVGYSESSIPTSPLTVNGAAVPVAVTFTP
jgi:hypothetical protein